MTSITHKQLYLAEAGADTLAFRKPVWLRVLSGVGCVAFVGLILRIGFLSGWNPWVVVPFGTLSAPVALAFLYQSGPGEITFDLLRRTYSQRLPWPYRHRAGGFDQVAGFRIFGQQRRSGRGTYHLCLVIDRLQRRWWFRHPYADHPDLGCFSRIEEARRVAQEIAAVLGVRAQISETLTKS